MSNHNKETEARCFHCYRHYVEGTAAWALYMMRMEHKVTNPDDPRVYYLPEGGMIQVDGMEIIAGNQWIDYWCIDIPDGWEIYEEPKPLLADAKVGDICKRRDGMIKFETINGTLCRMVEPTPLTPESKFPCVVRLIQDETMLGKANIRACHPETLASKRICSELTDNGLFMDGNYTYRYEIIGYPVADGSLEWALYQIRSGKKVVKEGYGKRYGSSVYKNRLFYLNGYGCLVTKNAIGLIDPCSEEEFLSLDETRWQLHEEPEYKGEKNDRNSMSNMQYVIT